MARGGRIPEDRVDSATHRAPIYDHRASILRRLRPMGLARSPWHDVLLQGVQHGVSERGPPSVHVADPVLSLVAVMEESSLGKDAIIALFLGLGAYGTARIQRRIEFVGLLCFGLGIGGAL